MGTLLAPVVPTLLPDRPASVETLLRANLERVRERISRAADAVGRSPSDVRLLAVTKSVSAARAAELARLGQLDLGENRVDVLGPKAAALAEQGLAPRWHMIGHLQRNKARRAVQSADVVHSVDTPRLLEALSRLAVELGKTLDVFLEVRAVDSGERTGFAPSELQGAVELAAALPALRLRGLMAMAAPAPEAREFDLTSQAAPRRTFAAIARLGAALPREAFLAGRVELSMGMSSDLEAAVAEGATWVRIGTALFEGLPTEEVRP
jgi:pyridoxal phosphate enzyme (YggS family)